VVTISAFQVAQRFVGTHEIAGAMSNPLIVAMLRLDTSWPDSDDVAWCSAFVNFVCWLLRLPRSKSLRARSWLMVGIPIGIDDARADSDIVILKRGAGQQPGPDVIAAPGHVCFYAGHDDESISVLAGNQSNAVNVARFPRTQILSVRRL